MKYCTKCNKTKELSMFGINIKNYKDKTYTYYNSRCKACASNVASEHQKTNPNKQLNNKRWADKNRDRLRIKNKKHRINNLALYSAKEAKRRACKLKQTPKWADLEAIKQFYKSCPKGYHVDHIIPLNGKNVKGLHVLENLQYLPAIENIRKSNKVEV